MVKVGKRHNINFGAYPDILNYYALVVNPAVRKAENVAHTFQLAELASSAQDIEAIKMFFNRIKSKYGSLYKQQPCNFRLIVSDYSWAIMHSVIDSFNGMSVIDYSKVVYKIGNE